MQRISKSGFADKLQQHGLDADRVARKLKELLDNADPKTQLNVVRLWCEIFDIVDKDKAKVVNTVVIAMNAVIQSCVAPEKRPEAFQRFGDSLGGH